MGSIEIRTGVAAALAAIAIAVLPGSSTAAVYWTSSSGIGRANLDGEAMERSFIGDGMAGFACGVAVDQEHVYWGSFSGDAIGRADISGAEPNRDFMSGLDSPCSVAVDGSYIYWASGDYRSGPGAIGRANLDGSGADESFIDLPTAPCGIAVDHGHVYWTSWAAGTIGRAELDGSGVNESFIAGATQPCGVAVTGGAEVEARHAILDGTIYWANNGRFAPPRSIGRANLDGTRVDPTFISGLNGVFGLALTDTHIFWGDGQPEAGALGRAYLDGTTVEQRFLEPGGGFGPSWVAVDATSISIRVGSADRRPKTGTARLTVTVPEPGVLALERTGRVRAASVGVDAKGDYVLPVRARNRAKRRLERTGSARVTARLAYTPEGAATPVTETVALRLVRR